MRAKPAHMNQLTSHLPHVLIVDSDPEARATLCEHFERHWYRVSSVPDGLSMRHALEQQAIDLIVMDPALPGENGLHVCRDLRVRSSVPLVMLSARDDVRERVLALEAGADDYLMKPFNPRELIERAKAVLRRSNRHGSPDLAPKYCFADWQLDVTARNLEHIDGTIVRLAEADFRVLAALLAHANRIVSRSVLMQHLANREPSPFDRTVDMRISRLRRILRDHAWPPSIIKTVRGNGYVLSARITVR